MRRMRMLQTMAGMVKTPYERRQQRETMRLQRLEREHELQMLLVDRIRERENGADGAPPMPLAHLRR